MRYTFTLIFSLLFAFTLNAQQNTGDYSLKVRLGNYGIAENTSRPADQIRFDLLEPFEGYHYTYLQFFSIPTQEEKQQVINSGIVLMDYLPEKAFIAAVPEGYHVKQFKNLGIRAVIQISPYLKMDERLTQLPFPDFATRFPGYVDLNIQWYSTIDRDAVVAEVEKNNFEILSFYENSNRMEIRVPVNKVREAASMTPVAFIEPVDPPAEPENYTGRTLHRSNVIATNYHYPSGRKYDGTGVTVAMGDDGIIGPHIDYEGRVDQSPVSNNSGNHGDHVAGIIFGAGNKDPKARGMAFGADLLVESVWNAVTNSPTTKTTKGVRITSTSYGNGCNAGYTSFTRSADQMIRQNPSLMHIFSAGNSGSSNCSYGAGSGWGNITGGIKVGKNVMAIGNLDEDGSLSGSSSRGPAHDGRIKPDVCAKGTAVWSTVNTNTYASFTGTSMACPGVSGTFAQLIHAYRDLNSGNDPESALIKGLIMNTADDIGNPGPDYKHGYGQINARRAVEVLENNQYFSGSVSQSGSNNHTITVPSGVEHLKVMVYWLDYEAATNASVALVNNLNMTVSSPGPIVYNPWVLDPTPNATNLNNNAVRSVDNLNNMEQVTIDNPPAGNYVLNVAGTSVPQGPVKYWVTYDLQTDDVELTYPIGGEWFAPGESEIIRWDAFGTSGNFQLDYSTNNGATWTTISSTISGAARQYSWNVPTSILTGQMKMRISRGGNSDSSDENFSIIGVPTNLTIDWSCPTSFQLSWDPVSGATGYECSLLGAKYMDSVGTSLSTSFVYTGVSSANTYWVSVRATGPGDAVGRRAIALEKTPGQFGCPSPIDAELNAITSPSAGTYFDCQASATTPITITIRNAGTSTISNVPVAYNVNGGPVTNDTWIGTLTPGQTASHTFSSTINLSSPGTYTIAAWTNLTGDNNTSNDTDSIDVIIVGGATATLPWSDDFEAYSTCATTTNCGLTTCAIGGGWVQDVNGIADDIDWRVDDGGTASQNTGPGTDYNPGTTAGNYIYLEASSNCNAKVAKMSTPCISLVGTVSPELKFAYHMYGSDMGSLAVDVMSGGVWTNNVYALSGDQGNSWKIATVSLSSFSGSTVNIRFRGTTGTGFRSDAALDDIQVIDAGAPPIADFMVDNQAPCLGQQVSFTDLSSFAPTSWAWNFGDGNTSSIQNPTHTYSLAGTYSVTLIATNTNGSDTLVKTAYVSVGGGVPLPFSEDFQTAGFPPSGWNVVDPGGIITWDESLGITGANGGTTDAAWVNNFSYNNVGAEDELRTFNLDMTSVSSVYILSFDVAYRRYSATYSDGMRVDVSTNCGSTWVSTTYNKSGTTLATGPDQTSGFTPSTSSDWRKEFVNLTSFAGNIVQIRFVNINGWGNNLYLDNVNLEEISQPTANFSSVPRVCLGDTVVFTDSSSGGALSYNWDFGNGASPTTANTEGPHSVNYSSPGTKAVTLIVNNIVGSDTITKLVIIDTIVSPTISITQTAGNNPSCNGVLVGFAATTTNAGASPIYNWKVNGQTKYLGPQSTYNTLQLVDGDIVTCEVSSSRACASPNKAISNGIVMNILPPPSAGYSYSNTNLSYSFTDTSGNNPTSWYWTFGDGNNSSSQNPSHTYTSSGTYTVCLVSFNQCGAGQQCSTVVVTCNKPSASFSQSSNKLSATFTDQSTANPTSWQWDFGDGNTSTIQNPNHSYSQPGNYTVCLITTNSCGSDTSCNNVTITCPKPSSGFAFTSTQLSANFTDQSGQSPTSWQWDFGDGASSTFQNPSHTYSSGGVYTVCLITTNSCGSDTTCQSVTITCPLSIPTFGYNASNLQVSFNGTASPSPGTWLWNFGDGTTSNQQNPSHTYQTPGTYTVCLYTTNSCGTDSSCQTLNVTCPIPATNWTYSATNLAVNFSDLSSQNPGSWMWDFGDGNVSNQQNPSHTYATPNTYTVCLITTNSCGSDTSCQSITVTCALPSASFTYSASGGTVNFTDGSTGATSWSWDFGDGNTANTQNPNHNYTGAGPYTVTLIATNSCGSDTSTQTITLVGLEDNRLPFELVVYPNPGDGLYQLEIDEARFGSVDYSVTEISGKVLQSGRIQLNGGSANEVIDLQQYSNGMYMLNLSSEGKHQVIKLIKQ